MKNISLSQALVDCEARHMMINYHDNFIRTLHESLHLESSTEEFKEYAERVLADEIVSGHSGWFEDIVGNAKIVGEKMFYDMLNDMRATRNSSSTPKSSTGGFDIYAYAEENPLADYMDMHTGYIYHIADYMRAKRFGLPTPGIAESENGKIIGYAQKMS